MNEARGSHRPPERFHVFVSYTTREDEVRIIKPIVDRFLNDVLRPVIERTIGEPPLFYDGYYPYHSNRPYFGERELEKGLRFAIKESEVLIAFISPEYFGSKWCRFECATMASKQLRPWFDLCRKPPISELRDKRPPGRRPSWWWCIYAKFLMWRWRLRKRPWTPGGSIVAVVWKGEVNPRIEMPGLGRIPIFDWTSCGAALDAGTRVSSHLFRHGSVSQTWEEEALGLERECQRSMVSTADAIAEILRERRSQYAQWE